MANLPVPMEWGHLCVMWGRTKGCPSSWSGPLCSLSLQEGRDYCTIGLSTWEGLTLWLSNFTISSNVAKSQPSPGDVSFLISEVKMKASYIFHFCFWFFFDIVSVAKADNELILKCNCAFCKYIIFNFNCSLKTTLSWFYKAIVKKNYFKNFYILFITWPLHGS